MVKPKVEWRRPTCYRRWPDKERFDIVPGRELGKYAKNLSTRHLLDVNAFLLKIKKKKT